MHHLKGLGVLVAAGVVVLGGVIGLRAVIAPDHPTFADTVEAADDGEEFLPLVVGAELDVSGDRTGHFSLPAHAPEDSRFGLVGDDGRMFFTGSGEGLVISQFSYDGLEFFPKEGDCTVTTDRLNEQTGVGSATVDCTNIRDIRDTATITVSGVAGLPADLVVERDISELGGMFAIDDQAWETGPLQIEGSEMAEFGFWDDAGRNGVMLTYEPMVLTVITLDGVEHRVTETECSNSVEELEWIDPATSIVEVNLDCPTVRAEGLEKVSVQASVVAEAQWVPGP